MDELKIETGFMKKLIAKIIGRIIRKKVGYEMDICLNEIEITFNGDKAIAHVNVDAEMSKEELKKIVKKTVL